jgi:prolyl-tRNA synthetase
LAVTVSPLEASYRRHRDAYIRIFDRVGLDYTIVSAMSGAMGGSGSEEFLAAAPVGEDTFVGCTACDYAANTEAVVTLAPADGDIDAWPALSVHDTPDTPTIESLVDLANRDKLGGRADWSAADTLKNVVLRITVPGGEPEVLIIGVPGDREVDLKRVEAALHPAAVALFEATDFEANPGLVRGYIGPQGLAGVRYLVDPRVVAGTSWLTGANIAGKHAVNVVCGRDFTPVGTIEAAEVRAGDPCPSCGEGSLTMRRGIEIGHIFQLSRRFANAFGLDALGPDSRPIRVTMGSYGIGVSRLVASIAEQHHDERGLVWPAAVAPAAAHIVAAGKGAQIAAALELGEQIAARGLDVIVDDRAGVSVGVKLTDAELIGVPTMIVVGRRLNEGIVERRDRRTGVSEEVTLEGLSATL